ncbi:BQ5605_C041g11975 [Microbotryum silenes-dioicae]|uniref:BQ5605_C041g11975 protein n=1 Tax=Microbotryum silenes-dioicae TaxID=796604 RepID=A0A2X0PPJ9_9BASI|nr:BQ5605_C041g11975 [Microbotryum silenes-dioicae]
MDLGSQSQESTSAQGQDRESSRALVDFPHSPPGQSSHSCSRSHSSQVAPWGVHAEPSNTRSARRSSAVKLGRTPDTVVEFAVVGHDPEYHTASSCATRAESRPLH